MRLSALLSVAVLASAGSAYATEYELDQAHTRVGFSVRHMMVSNVKGTFDKFKAQINIDDKDVTKSKVNADIDTASVDTHMEKRDSHLKSPDFFDSAKFPSMTFVSTKVEKMGENLKVYGNLTIHGVTKPVVLDTTLTAPAKFMGQAHMGFTATATLNRKDFGLVWNKPLETGGLLIGEDVKLDLEGELVEKAPTKS